MSPAILSDTATAEQIVAWAIETYKDRLALVTSFQYEGMVIVDMAARISKDCSCHHPRYGPAACGNL